MKATSTEYVKEFEQLSTSLLKIPVIDRCDHQSDKKEGFFAYIVFKDASTVNLDVTVLSRAFPSLITEVVNRQKHDTINLENRYSIIMAPYISAESAKQCERLGIGYLDMSGNCRVQVLSIYINNQGNPNTFAEKRTAKIYSILE
jgi:hypothetical protein